MKKCDLCHKPDKIHYRVKSIIHEDWIFVVFNVGIQFLNTKIIPTVEQESQNKFSLEITFKKNQIIRSFEINKITLNKKLTNNEDL